MNILFEHRDALDSTMDLARDLAAAAWPCAGSSAAPPIDIVIALADTQRAGRGRVRGRRWEDSPGSSLLTTLGFPEAERHGRALPLKMGLAVIRTLRSRYGTPDLAIKWPNDILARPTSQNRDLSAFEGYGKLGGILCESSGNFFFAGIGLNLRTMAYEARTLPDAISLEEVLGPEAECPSPDFTSVVERRLLAQSIAESFLGLIDAESWMEEFHSALWGRGGLRSFELGAPGSGRVVDGRIRGIDEDGALVLELDSGKRASFHSGELRSPR